MQVKHFHTSSGDVFVADVSEEFPDIQDLRAMVTAGKVPAHYSVNPEPGKQLGIPEVHEKSLVCGPVAALSKGIHTLKVFIGKWSFEMEVEIA